MGFNLCATSPPTDQNIKYRAWDNRHQRPWRQDRCIAPWIKAPSSSCNRNGVVLEIRASSQLPTLMPTD
ncbi:hypothetical protein AMECASPLE_000227 [Ameca splendens]|uniref:Uncharacterized protein n=1 Tax=Ameca splendens TaxID=208324 RepID=A0ABV0YK31_9TELE